MAAQDIHQLLTFFVRRKTRPLGLAVRGGLTMLAMVAIDAVHWDHFLLLTTAQTTRGNRMNLRLRQAVEDAGAIIRRISAE